MLFLLSIIFNAKNRKNAPPYIGGYFPEPERSSNEEFEFRYGTPDLLAEDILDGVYSPDECMRIFEEIFLLYKREQYPVQELLRRLVEDDRFTGELFLYTNGYSLFYDQMWPSDTLNRIEEYWFHNMDQLVDNIFNGIFTDEEIQIIFKLSFIVYRYNDNRFLHALKNDIRLTRELISLGSSEVEEFFRNRSSYEDDMFCCEDCMRIKIPLFMLDLFPDNDWNLRDFLHETLILTAKTAIKLQNAFPDRIVSSYLGDNDQELKMLCDLIYENHENSRFTEFFEGLNNLIECGFNINATNFDEFMEVIDTVNSPLEITFLDGDTVELPVGWAYESLQELFQRVALQQGLNNPWLYFGDRFVNPHMDFHIRQALLNGEELDEVLMGAYYNSATFEDRVQYNPGCMEGIGQRLEETTFEVHILELPCDCQIALQSCVSHFNY